MMQILKVYGEWGCAVGAHVNFGVVLEGGPGGALGETKVR